MDVELFVSCQPTGADRWQTHVCGASRAHVDVRESVPESIENYQCFVTIANVRDDAFSGAGGGGAACREDCRV